MGTKHVENFSNLGSSAGRPMTAKAWQGTVSVIGRGVCVRHVRDRDANSTRAVLAKALSTVLVLFVGNKQTK